MNYSEFKARLRKKEGKRDKPYRDSAGKLTVGYGRNLDDVPLSEDEMEYLLENDARRAVNDASRLVTPGAWMSMGPVRRAVLADMRYNLGEGGIRKFKRLLAALEAGDYDAAAAEIEDSLYFTQVGDRARENRDAMRTGAF